jgi:hypothetical protein
LPTSVAAALIIVLAIVPGVLAASIYHWLNGRDWRATETDKVIRALGFSLFGLCAYVLLANLFDWPPAMHVIPSSYSDSNLRASKLASLVLPYLGHVLCSVGLGAAAAGTARLIAKLSSSTHQPCAWDVFGKSHTMGRWVVVTLTSGARYCGIPGALDLSVAQGERDILLGEPALYDPDKEQYISTTFDRLFLPAAQVVEVGSLYDADKDTDRLVQPGHTVSTTETGDAKQVTKS